MCDEISHSYLVIGNRIMGWESRGQTMPHRRHEQRTPRNQEPHAKINKYPRIPGIPKTEYPEYQEQ